MALCLSTVVMSSLFHPLLKMKNSETSSKEMTSTIAQIIVVVGGPSGIHPKVQDTLANVFQDAHYEVVKVAMPGGLQHTNVVLANFLWHMIEVLYCQIWRVLFH